VGVAFLGAGNYAKGMLLPALGRCSGVDKRAIVTATGPSARSTAEKFGFADCGTDPAAVFDSPDVQLVFVATQHDSHAALAEAALRAGKAVWVEKPPALTEAELVALAQAVEATGGFVAVGYNRRFSPHGRAVRKAFESRQGPASISYTVAAGATPGGTWHTDPAAGGGRLLGECGHFIDLCSYLGGAPPTHVYARALGRDPETDDSTVMLFGFADGSTASLAYLANASNELPKERFELSADGRTAICDNFRTTRILGGENVKTLNQDKGQATAVQEVVEAVRSGAPSPFSLAEIVAVSRATFAVHESIRTGRAIEIPSGW